MKYDSKEACAKAILNQIAKSKKDTSMEGKPVTGISLPDDEVATNEQQ